MVCARTLTRVLDRKLCWVVRSSFQAASSARWYQSLTAISAARIDRATGGLALVSGCEMMANPVRKERA